MSNNRLILTLIIFYSFNYTCFTQKYEFGIGAGISTYKGDISPHFNPLQFGVGGNALFRYKLSRSVTMRANLVFSNYNSFDENTNDPFYLYRLKSVTGNFLEGSLIGEFNFYNQHTTVKNTDFTPYLFGGIGFARFKNKADLNAPLSINTPIIPYGVGVKYRFKGPFSIGAEFGSRLSLTDDLDLNFGKFGKTNPTGTLTKNNQVDFGDTSRKDQYFFTSITLTYTIFNIRCLN